MRVLLVNPGTVTGYNPIGLSSIQANLKRHGFETDIFDTTLYAPTASKQWEMFSKQGVFHNTKQDTRIKMIDSHPSHDFLEKIEKFKPELVGFTVMTNHMQLSVDLASVLKLKYPEIPVIFGGVHPTVVPEEAISLDCVDIICVGEGEQPVVELCKRISNNLDYSDIYNIWIKKNGSIARNSLRKLMMVDELPFLDWSNFPEANFLKPYRGKFYRAGHVELGRGCPYSCTYCVNDSYLKIFNGLGRYARKKSTNRIIEELVYYKQMYNLEMVKFQDETFLFGNADYFTELSRQYKKEIGLPFIAQTRVETVTDEKIKVIKEMGCVSLSIGIESGNQEYRKTYLKRAYTNQQCINAFDIINKYRIRTMAFNMIGLPDETYRDIRNTIKLNRRCRPTTAKANLFYPYPGTSLYEYCLTKGYIEKEPEVVEFRYDTILKRLKVPKDRLRWIAHTFYLRTLVPEIFSPLVRLCESKNWISQNLMSILIKIFRYYREKFV